MDIEKTANTDNGKTSPKKRGPRAKKPVEASKVVSEANLGNNKNSSVVQDKNNDDKMTYTPKSIDLSQIVQVYNGFQGKLIYISKKTGETFIWDEFGDYQDMELGELRSARSSSKKFFINNWFMFDEDWIVDYLGMNKYYKNTVSIEDFDSLFDKSVDELIDILNTMSDGQKKSVAYRARQMIEDGDIDSNKKITALEKCLGVELVER